MRGEFLQSAAPIDAEAVLVATFGAGVGDQFGTASGGALVAEYYTFVMTTRADPLLNKAIVFVFFLLVIDIDDDGTDADDQQKEK